MGRVNVKKEKKGSFCFFSSFSFGEGGGGGGLKEIVLVGHRKKYTKSFLFFSNKIKTKA